MSFLEGVGEPVFRCSSGDLGACGGRPSGLVVRVPGRPQQGLGDLWAFAGALGAGVSAPCRPLPALAPARSSPYGLISSGSRALEQLCLQTSPGRAGVRPCPAGARPPPASGGVPRPGRGGLLETVPAGASA